jgi:hypothetical protein
MLKKLLPALCLFFLAAGPALAQCDSTQTSVRLEIDPDQYWYEVSWKITDLYETVVYASGALDGDFYQTFQYCLDSLSGCTVFRIYDSYGDAIVPDGFYRLYVDDSLLHQNTGVNYHFGETVPFGCAPGTFCTDPLPVDTGLHVTPSDAEAWYRFVPADTGAYRLSTCGLLNLCASRIWVYDACQGIVPTPNNLGTLFYAEDGCTGDTLGAEANLYLAGGQEYFFRMAYDSGFCSSGPLAFELTYLGPISGCTDPLACNFNPLATVADSCIYPGDPDCTDLPDLVVLEDVLRNSLSPATADNGDGCAVEEGCLRGFGLRHLVRFTTHIQNTGPADYFIGETPASPLTPTDQFVWDPCHFHWHYRGYAEYILFDAAGTRLPVGSKNGFCVLDLECDNGGDGKFTCGNMGITAGCGDIYDASLPCQWVDVTGLPASTYTLAVRVNWDQTPDLTGRIESDYSNNWAQACFSLEYNAAGTPQIEPLDDCPPYTDCLGELYGDAQPDCNGVCNGLALRGDLNEDLVRDSADIAAYLEAARLDGAGAAACTDLDANDTIDVYDAALLQECLLHADDPQFWGTGFPCQFPAGVTNPGDAVYLLPGALDTAAKTLDIKILNPFSRLLAFEFTLTGLEIDSVENIGSVYDGAWKFNAASGKLLSLTATESFLPKHIQTTPFVRVHYTAITGPEICLGEITAVVNEEYQRSAAQAGTPACLPVITTTAGEPGQSSFTVFAVPNPATDQVTLFFPNPDAAPVMVSLADATGRVIRQFAGIRDASVVVQRGELPAGLYFYSVEAEGGRAAGKVMFR